VLEVLVNPAVFVIKNSILFYKMLCDSIFIYSRMMTLNFRYMWRFIKANIFVILRDNCFD